MKISSENKVGLLTNLVKIAFKIDEPFYFSKEVNKPHIETPCIYALWHGHQCSLYGLSDKKNINVLISRSVDGQIIASAAEFMGIKSVRGSKGRKGSIEGTMQMISKLKNGESAAITVDGPRGPKGIVNDGIIKIAKLSGCPIIPYIWYSKDCTWISLPTWDSFNYPLGYTRMINLFGDPIYVDENSSEDDDEKQRLKLEHSLHELYKTAPQEWDKVWKHKLW
jgi:hypothetical protein